MIGAAEETPEVSRLVSASAPGAVQPGEARAWDVDLDLAAFGTRGQSRARPGDPVWIRVDLAMAEPLVVEMTENTPLPAGGHGWVGRWADEVPGHAVFVVRNGKVYGSLRRPWVQSQYPANRACRSIRRASDHRMGRERLARGATRFCSCMGASRCTRRDTGHTGAGSAGESGHRCPCCLHAGDPIRRRRHRSNRGVDRARGVGNQHPPMPTAISVNESGSSIHRK